MIGRFAPTPLGRRKQGEDAPSTWPTPSYGLSSTTIRMSFTAPETVVLPQLGPVACEPTLKAPRSPVIADSHLALAELKAAS